MSEKTIAAVQNLTSINTVQQQRHLGQFPGPKSVDLARRREKVVARGIASLIPGYADIAEDGIVQDVDGNRLIDFGTGIAVTTVGARNRRVLARLEQAMHGFTHTCFMITPYESYVAVAEKLVDLAPGEFDKKVALFNSGSEAVENAVKIARHYTGRDAVVVFDHGYHGRTNLTMAMTAKVMPYKQGFGPFAGEVYRVPMSYPFRDPQEMTGAEAAERAISMIDKQVGAANVACVVIEPIQGEGGFVVPAEGFLPALQRWSNHNGAVFVADEIQSGLARTGDWFAVNYENVVPDLITVAKGLAGGMPLSGVIGKAEIMDSVHPSGLGGTYGGNPLACAAALGSLEAMAADGLLDHAKQIEQIAREILEPLVGHGVVGEFRGRGAMLALELVEPGTRRPHPTAAKSVSTAAIEQGVITLTCGTYGNILRLLPPLVISTELLREGLTIIAHQLRQLG